MSGVKETYVSMTQSEANRLRRDAAKAADLAKANAALADYIQNMAIAQNNLQNNLSAANNRINGLTNTIAANAAASEAAQKEMQNQIVAMMNQTQARFVAMNDQFNTRIGNLETSFRNGIKQVQSNLQNLVDSTATAIRNQMTTAVTNLQSQLGTVNNRLTNVESTVQGILGTMASETERANAYADTAETIFNDLSSGFRMETLLPGRLAKLKARNAKAKGDIKDAVAGVVSPSVAYNTARDAAEEAIALYEEAVIAEQLWQQALYSARQALEVAMAKDQAARSAKHPAKETVIIDCNHWSNGELDGIRARLNAFAEQLNNPGALTVEQLNGIQQACSQSLGEIDDVTAFAFANVSFSQTRANNAGNLARTFFGMDVLSRGYQGRDQRGGYRLHLKDRVSEFEIVITQNPVILRNGELGMRVESDIINYGNTCTKDAENLARQIRNHICGNGFNVGATTTVDGFQGVLSDRTEVTNDTQWLQQTASLPQR